MMSPTQRTPFVAGNWKMNTDRASAIALAQEISAAAASEAPGVDLAICPPLVYLECVAQTIHDAGAQVSLGAQNVHYESSGAYTGEISTGMLQDLGVRFVLAGHSERRHVLGESDELVGHKTRAILEAGLECILCVGETNEQRQAGQTDEVNKRQIIAALGGIDSSQLDRLTIAYEPVWAIGTGLSATPADAQNAHANIRALVASLYTSEASQKLRILYGGSVKPGNASELMAKPDIDGGLIGGASLKANDFLAIAASAEPQRA